MCTTDLNGESRYRPTGYPRVAKELPLKSVAKPTLKRESGFGWTCTSEGSWGHGDNPSAAYVMWADSMAMRKEHEERMRQQASNDRREASKYWNGDYANEP